MLGKRDLSKDPSPAIPTYRTKEEKGKTVVSKKGARSLGLEKALALLFKPASFPPSIMGSAISFHRDTEKE